jgi:putative ABC transport system permease protein
MNLMVVERAYSLGMQAEAFKQEALSIPGVLDIAGSNTVIQGGFYYGVMFQAQEDSEIKTTRAITIDDDYIETMGIEIVEGRGFQREFDDTWNILINEATIREFGWTDPVGMKVKRIGDPGEPVGDYTVVGVFRDFHYNSLHEDIDSFALFSFENAPEQQRGMYPLLNVRFRPENTRSVLGSLEETWNKFAPEQPFSSYFLDDRLAELYHNEQTSGQIFGIFSVLTIVIASIGLFGLSAYTAELRTKEIGIRKVLGSTASKIVVLLSKDFARLILIAFVFALPAAYYIMYSWLRNFAFRIGVEVWIFLLAGAAALLIAQLTISFQAVKAASTDPAATLKFE